MDVISDSVPYPQHRRTGFPFFHVLSTTPPEAVLTKPLGGQQEYDRI
jgi:hypothetical protein